MAQTRGLCVWEAELNRLQGEVLLQQAVREGDHILGRNLLSSGP